MSNEITKSQVREVWQEMAPGWERQREFVRQSTQPLTDWMVEKLQPQPGQTILDLAAGPGDLGFSVLDRIGPEGRLISTDFAPEMVEAAKRHAAVLGITNAEFRVLDAEKNDLPEAGVDGVMCRWGYMLMLDPAAALAETRRVLREGGRLVFSVMAAPEMNPWGSIPVKTLVDLSLIARIPQATPGGLFSLADHDTLTQMLHDAGFDHMDLHEVDFHFRLTDYEDYWTFLREFAGAVSVLISGLGEEDRRKVKSELEQAVEGFRQDDGYDFPGRAVNVLAY